MCNFKVSCGSSKVLVIFFVAQLLILAALAGIILLAWSRTVDYYSEAMNESFEETHALLSQISSSQSEFLSLVNSSTSSLARLLAASVEGNLSSFHVIEKQVAPILFMAFSTIPYVSEVSYLGKDGLFFSYYRDLNQTRALFSNTSWHPLIGNSTNGYTFNLSAEYRLYGETIDIFTGNSLGDQVDMSHLFPKLSDWMHKLLQQNSISVVTKPRLVEREKYSLLFVSSIMDQSSFQESPALVSLSVPADNFVKHYVGNANQDNASIYFATEDGMILAQRGSLLTYSLHGHNFVPREVLCCKRKMENNRSSLVASSVKLNVNRKLYIIRCAPIKITKDPLVLLVVSPHRDVNRRCRKMGILATILLASMLLIIGLVNSVVYHLSRRYQERISFLHASHIRCKESLQQAERKSMNKSLAFASANHDVRTCLAGITGLIELCRSLIPPWHDLQKYMEQMNTCCMKLLGIVNSVLDISKIEAGKMHLEEVEFDMIKVIEESMDMFYIVAMKKGLELIWDPCDFSVFRSTKVRGDCQRLKQILDNLLGNAVKFTREGHIILRAWIGKSNLHSLEAPSGSGCRILDIWSPLTNLLEEGGSIHNESGSSDIDRDHVEFVFEVDDSGVGIPKDNRSSVFENYIQVKEATHGRDEAGTGLGLGIVQSFVRLMGGEINILDKDVNEKGTCFRFNIILKGSESIIDIQRDRFSSYHTLLGELHKLTVMHFIQGVDMRKILKRWMESFGASVWEVDTVNKFKLALERIKNELTHEHNTSYRVFIEEDVDKLDHDSFLRRTSSRVTRTHVFIIIDASYGPLSEILPIINNFAKGVDRNHYKIIWLRDLETPPTEIRRIQINDAPCDLVLEKPFHGSRIYNLLSLLQEPKMTMLEENKDTDLMRLWPKDGPQEDRFRNMANGDKPLIGWNILIVEDNPTSLLLAKKIISNLGASFGEAKNGEVALRMIREELKKVVVDGKRIDGKTQRTSIGFYYDLILMDCQLPEMNGYELTERIRREEELYNIHIPIVALSANDASDKRSMSIEAGMDLHETKPLTKGKLLNVIQRLNIIKHT